MHLRQKVGNGNEKKSEREFCRQGDKNRNKVSKINRNEESKV